MLSKNIYAALLLMFLSTFFYLCENYHIEYNNGEKYVYSSQNEDITLDYMEFLVLKCKTNAPFHMIKEYDTSGQPVQGALLDSGHVQIWCKMEQLNTIERANDHFWNKDGTGVLIAEPFKCDTTDGEFKFYCRAKNSKQH